LTLYQGFFLDNVNEFLAHEETRLRTINFHTISLSGRTFDPDIISKGKTKSRWPINTQPMSWTKIPTRRAQVTQGRDYHKRVSREFRPRIPTDCSYESGDGA
jgi:hypothetical protein